MNDCTQPSLSAQPPAARRFAGAYRSELIALAVFDHAPDGVLVATPEDYVLAGNASACELLRLAETELVAGGLRAVIDATDRRWHDALAARARVGRMRAQLRMRRGDGSVFEADVTSAVFPTDAGDRTCFVFRDITDHVALVHRHEEQISSLERLATFDDLTPLLNRRGLMDAARRQFATADRENVAIQVLYFDVNRFKLINDNLGHNVGDQVISRVGAELRRQLRLTDVAARLGGDEFVAVLYNLNSQGAELVIERIKDALVHPEGDQPAVTVTVGFSDRQPGGMSVEDVIQIAEERMRYLKRSDGHARR